MNSLKRLNFIQRSKSIFYKSIHYEQSRSLYFRSSLINKQFYSVLPIKYNNLYYGIYRQFSSKKPSSKKKDKKSPLSTPKASDPPEGDINYKADIQYIGKSESGELSTFVVIKEKTQETFSVIYIVGILFVCLPYTIYLVFKSLFSSSGSDKIRNETFDLIKEDSRILRILGHDMIAKQATQTATYFDDLGQERLQMIYQIQGSKGNARVDVEMLKQDKEWIMQYCIVTTQYSVISIVDNRSLFDRPVM